MISLGFEGIIIHFGQANNGVVEIRLINANFNLISLDFVFNFGLTEVAINYDLHILSFSPTRASIPVERSRTLLLINCSIINQGK